MVTFVIILQLHSLKNGASLCRRSESFPVPFPFYQCGRGSSPRDDALFRLSSLVLPFASRGFSPGSPAFVSNISKFKFDQKWKTNNPYVDVHTS